MRLQLLCTFILGLSICSVKAQVLSFDGISEIKPLKRGNTYLVRWTGGDKSNHIVVELVKDNQIFGTWEQVDNHGEAPVRLPHNLKPGDNYYFRISNRENDLTTMSTAIAIRRKIPLGVQLMAVAAVPLVIIILTSDQGEDHSDVTLNSPSPQFPD